MITKSTIRLLKLPQEIVQPTESREKFRNSDVSWREVTTLANTPHAGSVAFSAVVTAFEKLSTTELVFE